MEFEEYEENGKLLDADDNEINHLLGTNNYQRNIQSHPDSFDDDTEAEGGFHPMSGFDRENIKNFHNNNNIDYVRSKKALNDGTFSLACAANQIAKNKWSSNQTYNK